MPEPRPDVLKFLLERRSRPAKTLTGPAPDAAALEPILAAGLRVPDHGKLEPWELIVVDAAAMPRLADLTHRMGLERGLDAYKAEKAALTFSAAPLIVAVVSRTVDSEKVPAVEQVLSAGAVCLSLVNAALAAGWGANWLTGWTALDESFLTEALGIEPGAMVAGYVVIGTETSKPPERPRPDMDAKVRWIRT